MANVLHIDTNSADSVWCLDLDGGGYINLICSDGHGESWHVLAITPEGSILRVGQICKDDCNTQLQLDEKGRVKIEGE